MNLLTTIDEYVATFQSHIWMESIKDSNTAPRLAKPIELR
jgi:hypothetical protein